MDAELTFEESFDFWLAKKVDSFLKEGYNIEQTSMMLNLLYSDFNDCIDDKYIMSIISQKIKRTLEIFMIGERNEQAN